MEFEKKYEKANEILSQLRKTYSVYAPKRSPKQGRYSDIDIIRYAEVTPVEEIEYLEKSDYPAKEVINPIQETIFYFTEDEYRASKAPKKPILLLVRPLRYQCPEGAGPHFRRERRLF